MNQVERESKLVFLKNQKIITNKRDIVSRTWLKGHPSLGQSDQVVWVYELVMNEYESKLYSDQLMIHAI